VSPAIRRLWLRNGLVWLALMALLALTLGLAFVLPGRAGTAAGLAVAALKTGLVLVLFMELGRAHALVRLAAAAGLFWVAILFALTLADVLARLGRI
jgi:cytochrome c oxidase subunit IV